MPDEIAADPLHPASTAELKNRIAVEIADLAKDKPETFQNLFQVFLTFFMSSGGDSPPASDELLIAAVEHERKTEHETFLIWMTIIGGVIGIISVRPSNPHRAGIHNSRSC